MSYHGCITVNDHIHRSVCAYVSKHVSTGPILIHCISFLDINICSNLCCEVCHCYPYNGLLLENVSTIWASRTWSIFVGMFIWSLLPTLMHQGYIISNMCKNSCKYLWKAHNLIPLKGALIEQKRTCAHGTYFACTRLFHTWTFLQHPSSSKTQT